MQGILYVSHGSRIREARQEAVSCIQSVIGNVNFPLQEMCFLELAAPTVEQGIDRLVNRGATAISVIPVLLLSAGHYYHDIPEELRAAKAKYPDIHWTYGKPLGVQDRFIDVLAERIQETGAPANDDAKIMLVGRGSRHPDTIRDIQEIGGKLRRQTGFAQVDICFLAACGPTFDEALKTSIAEDHSQVFVVPYLWFTGVLMRSIREKLSAVNVAVKKQFICCNQLGSHALMQRALAERVYESVHFDEFVSPRGA
ncbi:sirohydrochlorin ferrochelatase [Lentibacillus persicus]|uniref:Sirohydrochlorin ferrochelatase n=1 Tax=Lentibacillus persicus TaxID=640948 RepID=A0A1I1W435_9BACI|nr:sirohydrochlorin chelatase [Lentibacillus persicus]SFD89894.1 sirohydrochlorin ferrochelatase [Lentibacillus persicus]